MTKRYICKVHRNKASGHKFVTIAKADPFEENDWVEIIPLREPITEADGVQNVVLSP